MLDHIHIENFRLFKNLDIPKLGQVNLITGKNNSGKTTLLEALRLWGNRSYPQGMNSVINSILLNRGELNKNFEGDYATLYYNGIFKNTTIRITDEISISFQHDRGSHKIVSQQRGDWELSVLNAKNVHLSGDKSFYISAGFDLSNARLWQKIELTDKEDKVAEVLRIIEPDIVRVSVNEADGSAKVRLKNSPKPLPLKNFGEGMNRLLSVALGLVSAENDMLLIDEIDLGLHHSVQHLLWEIVFQKAKDLNVQVFATTHSSDCVQAFSNVANKPEYVGMGNYIRLQRKKDGDIVAVDYEMEELESAMDLNLETR